MKKTVSFLCIGLSAVMLLSTGCSRQEAGEKDNGIVVKLMSKMLDKLDYPSDKRATDLYDKGDHRVHYWRYIFPEFPEAMHTGRVAAIM